MYPGEITRNTLLVLVDAAPQPILFGGKAPEQALQARYGGTQPRREGGDGSEEDDAAAALAEDPEKVVPATLQARDRARAPRLHAGRGVPARRGARRAPFCAAERVSCRDRRALDGLRQRAREGHAASSVGVGGQLYAIGLDSSLYQRCPSFRGVHA